MTSSVVQIYDMTDLGAQERVLGKLQGLAEVSAQAGFSGPDQYVVIECGDSKQAHAIFTLITSMDSGARLIHSTNGEAPDFGPG